MMTSEAFRAIYETHYTDVLRFVRSFVHSERDVEDIVQDVFVQVARHYADYRGQAQIRTWLFAIAKNTITDHWRKNQRLKNRPSMPLEDAMENLVSTTQEEEPEARAIYADEMTSVRACIDKMPEHMRAVLLCRAVNDLNTSETANVLGWSATRVRVTYSRALKKFKIAWCQANPELSTDDATG